MDYSKRANLSSIFNSRNALSDISRIVESRLTVDQHLILNLPKDDIMIGEYEGNIKLILTTLIENAIKFTQRGAIIVSMDFQQLGEKFNVMLSVQDTGIGMTKEEEDFALGKSLEESKINLVFCKHLITMMGGNMIITSKKDLGTKITINIKNNGYLLPKSNQAMTPAIVFESDNYERIMAIFNSSGKNGELMARLDWSKTPLGPIKLWPQSLVTAASICLKSNFPMLVWWGSHLTMFYNNNYTPLLGNKHPTSLGQSALECWPEIASTITPMVNQVMQEGRATWSENQMLALERHGFVEECYFTYSYSPIHNETNQIAGIFMAGFETTKTVISQRRLNVLKEVGLATSSTSLSQAYQLIKESLKASASFDIPFGLLYCYDKDRRLVLQASLGLDNHHNAHIIELNDQSKWSIDNSIDDKFILVDDLASRFEKIVDNQWKEQIKKAIVLFLKSGGQPSNTIGVFIAGLSPRLEFDDDYSSFMELTSTRISNILESTRGYEEQLNRAEELAKLDNAKTQFFTNISHEFRTPLTLMLGPLADSLSDSIHPLDSVQRNRQQMIQNNSIRLLKLVNNILDFSRIEAGRAHIKLTTVDISHYTRQLCSIFQPVMDQADIEFIINIQDIGQKVDVDRDMWEKIVLNLISNAFKFTLKGFIRVALQREDDHILFTISDSGVGIEKSEQPKIFERFYRAEQTRGRSFEGSGIGLALTQELIKIHAGTIDFQSEIDKGSTFIIKLPIVNNTTSGTHSDSTGEDNSMILRISQTALSEVKSWIDDDGQNSDEVVGLESNLLPKDHILVVEDNKDMRGYIHSILSPKYRVSLANDGLEALEKIAKDPPNLILSDVMMPRLDGFRLIKTLRDNLKTKSMPVILLSARAGEEAKVDGLENGADDYLVKTSFSEKELLARVRTHLELGRFRVQLEKEVVKKTEELTSLNKSLYAFIDMICHEIRNPQHGIVGCWEILSEQLLIVENTIRMQFTSTENEDNQLMDNFVTMREWLDNLQLCTTYQQRVMDEVILLNTLYSNKFKVSTSLCNVPEFIDDILTSFYKTFQTRHLTVDQHTNQKISQLMEVDTTSLKQILTTIIFYVIDNTEPGSKIHFSHSYSLNEKSKVRTSISITSRNLRVNKHEIDELTLLKQHSFNNRSIGKHYSTTGFSLAISNMLVKEMGGESINLKSASEVVDQNGIGFNFDIYCTMATANQNIIQNHNVPLQQTRARTNQVLVAEDNIVNQKLCSSLLRKQSYNCVIANNGREAIEKYQPGYYDFILMDIAMPEMNGIEATKKIRQIEEVNKVVNPVCIIGLSAYAQPDKILEAIQAGMNKFIIKPATFDKINSVIKQSLSA